MIIYNIIIHIIILSPLQGDKKQPLVCPKCVQGCKEGQAHPHISCSSSSPHLAVPARGFPGAEAGFVFLWFIAHCGLFLQELGWVSSCISGSWDIQWWRIPQCGSVLCEKCCVSVLTYFLFSPHLAEWETKEEHPGFAPSQSLRSRCHTPIPRAVSCANQGLAISWELFLPFYLHKSWTSPLLLLQNPSSVCVNIIYINI